MTTKLPTKFKDLGVKELRRSAIEDFAVEVDEKASPEEVILALTESGVTWADYVAQHPDVAPATPEPAPVVVNNVITSADVAPSREEAPIAKEEIVVQEPLEVGAKPYLIKMTRENPLFQTRGYTFTSSHPYQLVKAEDAEYVLQEDGFRQALPSELSEFYG